MGMSYDDYWDGEVGMKTAVRQAHILRLEQELRIADRTNWYMGQYVMSALQATPLLVGGFYKRGTHIPDYPNKPFIVQQDELKDEEDRKKKEEDQTKIAMAMFQAGIEKFNRNIQKRQEAEARAAESGQ